MDSLLPSFRRELRARAHSLDPVVSVGHHGLTAPVLHEIDVALTAHELVKVRVFNDDRDEREALLARISAALDCAPVQRIGKLLVLWRPRPPGAGSPEKPADKPKRRDAGNAGIQRKSAPAAERVRKSPPQPTRVRKAGKAPAGVPRAAAPRRRRRAP